MKELLGSLRRHYYPLLALGAVWSAYFSTIFAQTLRLRPNGLYAGSQTVWADWSLHIAIANLFAYKEPQYWFSSHPVFAGAKFTYPFVADLVSGMLMRLHVPLLPAMILPSFICTMLLILAVYAISFFMSDSTVVASISASLFFLFGGFVPYIIIVERAFLLGITVSFWSMAGLLSVLARPERHVAQQRSILAMAGILAGILPVTHPHAFIALVITAGCMCFAFEQRWRLLAWYVVPASVISSLLFLKFIYGGIQDPSFFSWLPGSFWGSGLEGMAVMTWELGNQIFLASAG
jgi:hypothetical protein